MLRGELRQSRTVVIHKLIRRMWAVWVTRRHNIRFCMQMQKESRIGATLMVKRLVEIRVNGWYIYVGIWFNRPRVVVRNLWAGETIEW